MDAETAADLAGPAAGGDDADARARAVEAAMTDDERFALVIGVMGQLPGFTPERDPPHPRRGPPERRLPPPVRPGWACPGWS